MCDRGATLDELRLVIDRVRSLFHLLKAAAEGVHDEGVRSAARRGVLMSLHQGGPQTVPRMAAARPVSRQHIQTIVNGLLDDGLVERLPNPAHKRSRLIRLTDVGQRRVRELIERESDVFGELDLGVTADELEQAASVLDRLAEAFRPESVNRAVGSVSDRSE